MSATSPIISKLVERPQFGKVVSRTHKENGTSLLALKGKSTLKSALCVGVGPSPVLAREKQEWVPSTQMVLSHNGNESLVPKSAMRPTLAAPQKKGSPFLSLGIYIHCPEDIAIFTDLESPDPEQGDPCTVGPEHAGKRESLTSSICHMGCKDTRISGTAHGF